MFRLIATVLLAGLLSACAASGSVQTLSANPPAIDSSKAGAVEVTTALSDKVDSADALRRAIVAQLVNKKVFKSVTEASSSDYILKVNVVDLAEVSQGARFMLGALAGQAGITANVEVYDRREGRLLSSMVAKGQSSGGHAFAGTTQEAIDLAAVQISDYLPMYRKN